MLSPWPVGVLVIAYALATTVQAVIDSRRDIVSPFRPGDLPARSPDAWSAAGSWRRGAWSGAIPSGQIVVTSDSIGMRLPTLLRGVRTYVVPRADVEQVVVVGLIGVAVGVGVIGPDGPSRLVIRPFTNRRVVEAHLDRLGWPHVRRRPRLLRPFA